MVRRPALLLVLASTLGCRRSSRVDAVPDPIATPKVAAVALCAGGAAKARQAYALAARQWLGDAGPSGKPLVGWCKESDAGAWWFDLPPLSAVKDAHEFEYVTESKLVVVFTPRSGEPARYLPKDPFADYGVRAPKEPWTWDYDHDGVPELYVESNEEGDEGHRAQLLELLTYRGGAVAPYPPAVGFRAVGATDADGDGAPDLLLLSGYGETLEGCGAGFPYSFPEPRFLAHARPDGAFSTDDAQAKAFTAKWCPAAPKAITSSDDALCARLWAKDVAKERKRVLASCAEWDCTAANDDKPQKPGAAEDCARRARFYDKAPPFTLP